MKLLLTQYASYHLWANQELLDRISALDRTLVTQPVKSSFGSLQATVLHMWDAESVWWQRMKLLENIVKPSQAFSGSWEEASAGLLQQSKFWHDWISQAGEHVFDHEFIYHTMKKERFKQPVFQVALHVFNHATCHRGQLVNMLRQLEVEKIPQTDFIFWSRKR